MLRLHAICGFRRQYCSRRYNLNKYTFFLYFQNISSVLRQSNTFLQLAKEFLIASEAVAKGYQSDTL
jgi:hypothetical protein